MKAKFVILYSAFVLSVFSAYAADTFFFLAPSSGSNVNDMSLWKQLSTFKNGDNYNFYVFPKGADDRIPGDIPDGGKWEAGALSSDQSKTISADSDVIINSYCMGELQPDGSVAFGNRILGDNQAVVFTDSFTAGNMRIRINNRIDINFAPAEVINLNLSSLSIYQIAHTYINKTTSGVVNINIDGDFSFGAPTSQSGCDLNVGAYDGFFGPGTGSFFIIAQHLLLRMGLVKASATAKVFNLASNAGAFAVFATGGVTLFSLGVPLAAANIAGNQLGTRLAIRIGARMVRNFLYVTLSLLLSTLVYRFFLS